MLRDSAHIQEVDAEHDNRRAQRRGGKLVTPLYTGRHAERAIDHLVPHDFDEAFQVTDDILDETGSFEEMGKGIAKDRAKGKWTYPVAHGMPAAIERASELERETLAAVSTFGAEADPLRELVGMVRNRRK